MKNNNKISNIKKKSIKVGGTQIDPNLALCPKGSFLFNAALSPEDRDDEMTLFCQRQAQKNCPCPELG